MSTMQRLLCLPAHSDFALQLCILPGKLLKHAVDCSRETIEFVRSTADCNAARKITFDDGGCNAADFVHLGKKRTMNQPPYGGAQYENDAHGTGNPVPEAFD